MPRKVLSAIVCAAWLCGAATASAAPPPLLPEGQVAAIADEIAGGTAKRNLEFLATQHRQRGSQGFHAAAEFIAQRAREYGLEDVEVLQFPADGKIYYGTQRSRPPWDAQFAELRETTSGSTRLLASYEAAPVVLAEDSESADVEGDLVDVGDGTREADYAGQDVRGRFVLAGQQPEDVAPLAVARHGAAGIISYAQNQATGWQGADDTLVRWGHLDTFAASRTFAFMVSLRDARALQRRLAAHESIRLHAVVRAGQHPGAYEVVTATIPGADARLRSQEIAWSCHLDHQRPGANDNASGCATILEVARTLQRLIADGRLPRPARTLRFIWPPEIEGTEALLNARPGYARRIRAVVHMDMVGGGPATQAVFHVTRGPWSLPSFIPDVAWAFASWVNAESYEYAATGSAAQPLLAPEGGREPLRAEYSPFTMGSDHEVYEDSSFRIPAIYLNDWPDRYIHTDHDSAANIDPTKLRRAGFIGAASGYFLANYIPAGGPGGPQDTGLARTAEIGRLMRATQALERGTAEQEAAAYERAVRDSMRTFGADAGAPAPQPAARSAARGNGDLDIRYRRLAEPRGPLTVFGYDYLQDHAAAAGMAMPQLPAYQGNWGDGTQYAYEALNLADGSRTVQQVADTLSAEFGPVPAQMVLEYLRALQRIGVVR